MKASLVYPRHPIRQAALSLSACAFLTLAPLAERAQPPAMPEPPAPAARFQAKTARPNSPAPAPARVAPAPSSPAVPTPHVPKMELAVNLPEFRLRYYEDGVQRDSAKIACGKHVSPVIEVQQNEITYRPAFIPTEDEKHMKRPLRPAPPERTNAPQKPRNPLGRRRIVVDGPFRLHGTAWPESMEHNASGGCLRVDNTPDERITDTMVLHGTGHRAEDRPGWSHTYRLPVRFTIRVYYRLWNDLQATDSTLLFRAWPDVHHRLTGRKPRKCPVHDDVKGNAYKLEHLLSDLSQMGLTLKPGFTPQSAPVQKLWATMRAALEKNRKKGAMLSVPLPRNVFERRPGNAQYSSSALYQH